MVAMPFTDDDAAALYDLTNPWDPDVWPSDAFHEARVMAAESVLDVGCGTGAMLARARERGHVGRLAGIDPDRAALARARARSAAVTWVEGTAANAAERTGGGFALAVMTGHAFQCLVSDEEVRASLAGVRDALRPGGLFAFETRHPQARAWEGWTPDGAEDVVDASGRRLRMWHEVRGVDGDVLTLTETVAGAGPDGAVLRVDTARLRFLGEGRLDGFLAGAGFVVEERYGDWDGGAVTAESRELVTVARAARAGR